MNSPQPVRRDLVRHLAAEVPGRHRVDPDPAAPGPLLVQVAGQPDEAGLAGRVGRLRREGLDQAEHAGDVDDGSSRAA